MTGLDFEDLDGEARRLRRLGWTPRRIAEHLEMSRRAVDRATGESDCYRPGAIRTRIYSTSTGTT